MGNLQRVELKKTYRRDVSFEGEGEKERTLPDLARINNAARRRVVRLR